MTTNRDIPEIFTQGRDDLREIKAELESRKRGKEPSFQLDDWLTAKVKVTKELLYRDIYRKLLRMLNIENNGNDQQAALETLKAMNKFVAAGISGRQTEELERWYRDGLNALVRIAHPEQLLREWYEIVNEEGIANELAFEIANLTLLMQGWQQDKKIEKKIGAVKEELITKVGDVEAKVGDVEAKVGDVEAKVGDVEAKVGDVERRVKELEGNFTEKLANLENAFGQFKQYVTERLAKIKNDIADLSQQVYQRVLVETIKRLKEYIRGGGNCFEELMLEVINNSSLSKKDVQQTNEELTKAIGEVKDKNLRRRGIKLPENGACQPLRFILLKRINL
jgi:hypothetical protein